jgi:hypothetical protein
MKSALRLSLLACVLSAFLPACAQVKPWQRATLAKPIMSPDRDPLTNSVSEHMWFTREAFAGGRGVGGGGCGCN